MVASSLDPPVWVSPSRNLGSALGLSMLGSVIPKSSNPILECLFAALLRVVVCGGL